jgi:hypothetical protein
MIGYSPDAVTESLGALTELLNDAEWVGEPDLVDAIRAQIASRLDDDEVHLRLLALRALPVIYPLPADAASAITRRIDLESNPSLLAVAVGLLQHLPYELADAALLLASNARTGGSGLADLLAQSEDRDSAELLRAWVTVHLNCYLQAGTPHATRATRTWFTQPRDHAEAFQSAVLSLRDIFAFNSTGPFRNKSFELLGLASRSLAANPSLADTDPATVAAIDSLVGELYFASGAYEGNKDRARPTPAERFAWYHSAIAMLEQLAGVAVHAHTCYQLLEVLEFLTEEDPARVFRAVAATVKATGVFRFEQLGMEIAVRLVKRYLADYRELFIKDKDLLTDLRGILEVFAQVGWPEALNLSYSLGDIFR